MKKQKQWDFCFNFLFKINLNCYTKHYIKIFLNCYEMYSLKSFSLCKMAINEFSHYIQCIYKLYLICILMFLW